MEDTIKTKGQASASKPDAGGGVARNVPVIGVVKNVVDSTRGGRLQVYIADFGSTNPDDSKSWTTVGYMSPFFGVTQATGGTSDNGSYLQNPSSYGMWFSPPDVGTSVVCIFINGDINYGYWIGCLPKPEQLQMVPAIGSFGNVITNSGEAQSYGGATVLPVTNINTNNSSITDSDQFLNAAKPVHSYQAGIYSQQGLIRDPVRGPISTSASRESPSRVGWGVNTPGRPIYQGGYDDSTIKNVANQESTDASQLKVISRRGGHSIVMDDGDINGKDQLLRLRTALGHQILMSDDGQTLFIIHSNGQSYIELGKEGTIDMYSTNSVNIRTQGDLNLHADNNININAAKDINIASKNLNINTEKDTTIRTGANFKGYSVGTYTYKVDGAMSMSSGGEGSYASGGIMYVNGSKVNLNTGSTSVTPDTVPLITAVAHTDTLFDKTKGWASAPGKLLSVVTRAPAHAPWASANQGVNVQVSNNSDDALPAAPSDAVSATNAAATNTTSNPVSTATASTVPAVGSVSGAVDGSVTATMVGGVAAQAAGAASDVVSKGTGIITDATGQLTAAVGSLAQTPSQLEVAGIIKPGASTLINGLVQGGANVQSAMTNTLFTGAPGAENLTTLATNVKAQVGAQIANFSSAQSALTQSGIITGNEAAGAVAGLVNATSQVGIGAVKDFVQNSAGAAAGALTGALSNVTGAAAGALTGALSNVTGAAAGALTGALSNVTGAAAGIASGLQGAVSSAIAGGNFAAGIGTNLTSGLGSIATSLGGIGTSAISGISGALDAAKGIAGSAFSAITKSFKPFKAGVPQDLTAINAKNIADQAASEASAAAGAASDALSSVTAGLPNLNLGDAANLAKGALDSATSAVGSLTNVAGGALAGVSGALAGVSGALTGASGALTSVTGALTSVTGAVSAATSGIAVASASFSALTSKVAGSIPSLGSLTSGTGLGALPGGLNAVSSVVNSATGALTSIPGLGGVSSLIKNASTAALNAVNIGSSALGAVASLGATASNALNNLGSLDASSLIKGLTSGKQSLAALASLGLPASASAALQAGINSLSTPGSLPITLPTVATGTNNRGQLTSQLGSVFGSSKIPAPNFSGTDQLMSEFEARHKKNEDIFAQVDVLIAKINDLKPGVSDALTNWHNLRDTLPKGDPQVDEAYQTYSDLFDAKDAIRKQAKALLSQIA